MEVNGDKFFRQVYGADPMMEIGILSKSQLTLFDIHVQVIFRTGNDLDDFVDDAPKFRIRLFTERIDKTVVHALLA